MRVQHKPTQESKRHITTLHRLEVPWSSLKEGLSKSNRYRLDEKKKRNKLEKQKGLKEPKEKTGHF